MRQSTSAQLGCLFVGMDVHKDNHAAVAVNCFGAPLLEQELGNEVRDFNNLIARVQTIAKARQLNPVFGLEDTAGSGEFLARYLFNQGYEVKTINPVLVKRERDYETHPEKSDLADALGVAKVLIQRIDSVPDYSITETTEISRDIRALTKDRETIVLEQTRLKNQLHALLHHSYGSGYKTLFRDVFAKKALLFWQGFPSAQILKSSRKRNAVKPDWISQCAAAELPQASETQANQIRRKVKRLLTIREELSEIEKELDNLMKQAGQHLNTLPGCGPILSAVVLAEVKDISRFKAPAELAKYAGCAPSKLESGQRKRHVKTRSGNRRLNKALYQIALTQISNQGIPKAKSYFQKKVNEGKSKKHALTCLKRQIVDIIWSMLKEKRAYYP
jgi:transposase